MPISLTPLPRSRPPGRRRRAWSCPSTARTHAVKRAPTYSTISSAGPMSEKRRERDNNPHRNVVPPDRVAQVLYSLLPGAAMLLRISDHAWLALAWRCAVPAVVRGVWRLAVDEQRRRPPRVVRASTTALLQQQRHESRKAANR